MVDMKTDFSIGHMRMKYLDAANNAFANEDYISCNGYLSNFLDTVDEKTEAGKTIKAELDKAMLFKKNAIKELEDAKKTMGYLEAKDIESRGRMNIEINALHDIKEIYWRISLLKGLFHE